MARRAAGPQIEFNGHAFTKDGKTGYYLSARPIHNGKRIRLHRYTWIVNNGEIPSGMFVHHKDGSKENNDISNLMLLPQSKHSALHMEEIMANHLEERMRNFIERAQPAAARWHKSKEGREWHKKHWETSIKPAIDAKVSRKCEACGKEYESTVIGSCKSMFCSKKCKAKYRRDSKVDDVSKDCIVCGKSFRSNKYEGIVTCSRSCSGKLRVSRRRDKKDG